MRIALTALLLVFAATAAAAADEQAWLADETGPALFRRFCAACHGMDGTGDGPVAPSLGVLIPDLTGLSARFGGKFPEDRVREIIDGRAVLPAHGTRPMPVWGYEFEAELGANEKARAAAQAVIDRLADFLRVIQRTTPAVRQLD